jgi:hypothetical protein
MEKPTFTKTVMWCSILEIIVYLFGFINWAASRSNFSPLLDIYTWKFGSIMYWSVLSCLAIVIIVLSFYSLNNEVDKLGLILAIVGGFLPLIMMWFLIIPATVLILATFFIYKLNLHK